MKEEGYGGGGGLGGWAPDFPTITTKNKTTRQVERRLKRERWGGSAD